MTQTAVVERIVSSKRAEVSVLRKSACVHRCPNCGSCMTVDQPTVLTTAENTVGAQKGDVVTVETPTARVLGVAAVVCLLPLALFFLFYGTARGLDPANAYAWIWGGAGFLAGVAGNAFVSWRIARARMIPARIVAVEQS